MSSYIEFAPEESTTKVTRVVRIDDDFRITIGVDTGGNISVHHYNWGGIPDDYHYTPDPADPNVESVQIVKDGAVESITTRIKMFWNANDDNLEPHQIPQAFIYSDAINKDNYRPVLDLPATVSQTFPLVIWNTLLNTQSAPPANTVAALTWDRRYARFGTLARRRTELKRLVLAMIDHPNYPQWLAGGTLSGADDTDVNALLLHLQGFQTLAYYPEMLARAISVDSNLGNERAFNLLWGMCNLDLGTLMAQSATRLLADYVSSTAGDGASNTTDRDDWTFMAIGSAAAQSPFAYTRGNWNMTALTGSTPLIELNGSSAIGSDWQAWLRT